MDDILGYMDKLNELDTASVEPMYTPVDQAGTLRADEVKKRVSPFGNPAQRTGNRRRILHRAAHRLITRAPKLRSKRIFSCHSFSIIP